MAYMSHEWLAKIWDCIGVPERQAMLLLAQSTPVPPYVVPEQFVKILFQGYYLLEWERYYNAWFTACGLEIVTRSFGGAPVTGIDTQTGAAVVVWNCMLTGGCGDADPCNCTSWFWRNKPLSPC